MAAPLVHVDLQRERDRATFDLDQLTYIFDGGRETTEKRRSLEKRAANDPELADGPNYNFLSDPEKYANGVRKAGLLAKKLKEYKLEDFNDAFSLRSIIFPNEASPMGLQHDMFIPAIMGHGTEEQHRKWGEPALACAIMGTYAQTELGHGTHLRGLETTATYDPATREFVLHSPTLTSIKWWPGGLGKTTNHALIMAMLYTGGKNHGLHLFMVQTRSLETHEPLSGVEIGDIGPTLGFCSIDNGFLRLDHFRIPRENMMMKNAQVLEDGTYVRTKSDKLSYGTMLFIRAVIVKGVAAQSLAQAATIAIRYSAVRRQSELKPGGPEPQVLDYVTQQYRLFPVLAQAYAFSAVGLELRDLYYSFNYDIQQGDVGLLADIHSLSCGLKAFTMDHMMWSIETCRLACGGHGFSLASGLPKLYAHAVPACTYEGENTVMYLQCGRSLVKSLLGARRGVSLSGSMAYLSRPCDSRCAVTGMVTIDALLKAYEWRAIRMVQKAARMYEGRLQAGEADYNAWNQAGVHTVLAAKAHCHNYVLKTFARRIQQAEASPGVISVLHQLCMLYATYGITTNSGEFLENGFMSGDQLDHINDQMLRLLSDIRPNAVALVDAFDISDHTLGSVLGRFDGQVYENLYKWAQQSPLNKTQVHPSFHEHLYPMMQAAKSKL